MYIFVLLLIGARGVTPSVAQRWLQNYPNKITSNALITYPDETINNGYRNMVTKIRLPKYGYRSTVTEVRLPKYSYRSTITEIRLPKYGYRCAAEIRRFTSLRAMFLIPWWPLATRLPATCSVYWVHVQG